MAHVGFVKYFLQFKKMDFTGYMMYNNKNLNDFAFRDKLCHLFDILKPCHTPCFKSAAKFHTYEIAAF